ncbi:hypothetical protein AT251_08960 [Enterovibrio nigricans]|nr:hypothetical protein [Enterovibrio nigricans]PKF50785.1 hypothetical protein AT251_08960 [Enterovibrio nigricans]
MFSQSLAAQLARWLLVLIFTLFFVHHCAPLRSALSDYAVDGGCHQRHSTQPSGHMDANTPSVPQHH